MDIDNLKREIADQITKTSLSDSKRWNRIFLCSLDEKELASSDLLLKKIVKDYRTSLLSLIVTAAAAIFFIWTRFIGIIDYSDFANVVLNIFVPLMMLLSVVFSFNNAFRLQRMKTDQEHKVFLHSLLEKIDN